MRWKLVAALCAALVSCDDDDGGAGDAAPGDATVTVDGAHGDAAVAADAAALDSAAPMDSAAPVDSATPMDSATPPDSAIPMDLGPPPDSATPDGAVADAGACAPEGSSVPVIPEALPCCDGLAPVGCEAPREDGTCPGGCEGAVYCARCGNGECGPGENVCNCPADCPAGGQCLRSSDCLDHPAPIRCVGAWRCDPNDAVASDHQGDDGCNYTCLFNLTECDLDQPMCPGTDSCRACPVEDGCGDLAAVCLDPEAY